MTAISVQPVAASDAYQFGEIGPHSEASVFCQDSTGSNDGIHKLSLKANLQPAAGYDRQYAAFRFWIDDWDGYRWLNPAPTAWTTIVVGINDFRVGFDRVIEVSAGYHYVLSEYAWWDGQRWSEAGLFTTQYTQGVFVGGQYYTVAKNTCDTSA